MRSTSIATHDSTDWLDLAIEVRSFDPPAIASVSTLELVAIPEVIPVEATPAEATRDRPGFFNRRTGALAGAAIALVGGTSLVQLANQPAQYEGKFQLLVEPTVAPTSAATQASAQAARSTPTVDYATQIQVLWSPKLLAPVVQQLQTQYTDLNYDTLAQKLDITHQAGEKTLEITYQDTDPQKVQAVLETVSRAYLEYSQECRTNLCNQLKFVEQRLPHLQQQVTIAQQKLQTLQQYGGADVLGQQLSQRSGVLAQQRQDLQIRLIEARTQVAILQKRLSPAGASLVEQSLAQNDRYQALRQQLQTIADQLAVELARPQSTGATLQPLKQHYQVLTAQMTQAAHAPIERQLAQTIADFQAKETTDYTAIEQQQTLLEGVTAATQVQVLTLTEAAIAQTEGQVQQQIKQWAVLARQYAELNLELKFATDNLNLYTAKRAELQQIIAPKPAWQLTNAPTVEPVSSGFALSDPEQRFSLGLLLSFMLVILVMSIADQTRQTNPTRRPLPSIQPESLPQTFYQTAAYQTAVVNQAATLFMPALAALTERTAQHQRTALFLLTAAVRLETVNRTKLSA
ncbi:MAG: GumC family protein [Stenomitos frigidus ULC029]